MSKRKPDRACSDDDDDCDDEALFVIENLYGDFPLEHEVGDASTTLDLSLTIKLAPTIVTQVVVKNINDVRVMRPNVSDSSSTGSSSSSSSGCRSSSRSNRPRKDADDERIGLSIELLRSREVYVRPLSLSAGSPSSLSSLCGSSSSGVATSGSLSPEYVQTMKVESPPVEKMSLRLVESLAQLETLATTVGFGNPPDHAAARP